MFKEIWNELKEKLVKGIKATCKEFLAILWDFVKDDVILSARKSLGIISTYLTSTEGLDKKEKIADLIMSKIKLPLPLKPFKGLIRKLIIKKIDEIVHDLINKGNLVLANGLKIVG